MTTENLKREMYEFLEVLKFAYRGVPKPLLFGYFDTALEKYLEALRQDRDDLRNRLQAFEFANKACGEELRAASELIQRQRKFIRTLYASRKARKVKGSASAQSSDEKAVGEILGAVQRLCQHSWRTVIAFPSGTEQKECIFCLKLED